MEAPLLHQTPVAASPLTTTIAVRLSLLLLLASIALWANHEASKGIEITVLRSTFDSHAARKFNLMFVSNGRAARILHDATRSIETALFPDDKLFPRKLVARVSLHLSPLDNLTSPSVSPLPDGVFIISVGADAMSAADASLAMAEAAHKGMARVWLWDGPAEVLEALEEHLMSMAGFGGGGGGFVGYCEGRSQGFVARLNREMRSEAKAEGVMESSARWMCPEYRSMTASNGDTSDLEGRQVMRVG